jgi:hypothetical protein
VSDDQFDALLAASAAARDYLKRATAESVARAGRAVELQATIEQSSVSLWSPGKEVRVVLAASGLLREVQYGTPAAGIAPAVLAALTVRTIRVAMSTLQDRVDEVTEDDSDVSQSIRDAYHQSFAEQLSKLEPRSTLSPE